MLLCCFIHIQLKSLWKDEARPNQLQSNLERTNNTLAARTDCKGFQVSKHNSVLDHSLSMISSYNMKQKQEASTRVVGAGVDRAMTGFIGDGKDFLH